MRQPALAHGAPLCQEASQGGMAFFVTPNEESGKAARVLRAPALFLLALIGGRGAAIVAAAAADAIGVFPVGGGDAAAGAFRHDARPSPFERHDASRDPRDAARCKSCAFGRTRHCRCVFFPSPFRPRSPTPSPTSAIQPVCIDVSNLSARDAARAAAIANCIDARRPKQQLA